MPPTSLLPRLILLSAIVTSWAYAQPTDNPVETYYGSDVYDWTNDIQWSQTFSILDYGGDNTGESMNDDAYVAARDAAAAAGGGVVYFPAGEYRFEDSINLVDHVVLRGDAPAIPDARTTGFRPPSRLTFPRFNFVASGDGTDPDSAFKGIGTAGSGINTGLVHLDVNRASVFAGGYGTSSENVVVFGVRSNNVASEQPWSVPTPEQNDWQIHPNRFVANISAFAYRNVLVANSRLNDAHYWLHRQADGKDMSAAPVDMASLEVDDFEQPGYLIRDGSTWKTLEEISGSPYVFEYTDHYGINVQGSTGEWGAPPWVQPNLFYAGATIRDNWVYTTMRVKIDTSGRGLVIKDNEMLDRAGKTRYFDPNGVSRVQNAATLENRGIDWRGHDVLIEGNVIDVRRHLLNGGPYGSVDGEAILHQEVHGSTIDGVTIRGNTVNAYIGIWKMPYTRNVVIEENTITRPGFIIVESDTNSRDFPMYGTIVRNNVVDGSINIRADYFSFGMPSANVYDNQLSGTVEIEDHGTQSNNTALDGGTPANVSVQTGAVAIDRPAEGMLFADADPDEMTSGQTATFTVLVTTRSVDVERVNFYRHKTLMGTVENPPYTLDYTSDGSRALWSAEVEQRRQTGNLDLYTALLLDPEPTWPSAPAIVVTGPGPGESFVAPATVSLSANVTPGQHEVERVEFYSGGTYLGSGAPDVDDYALTWEGVTLGTYSITAKVWDASGAVVLSETVVVEVSGAPDAAPYSLKATVYSDTVIDLSWSNGASNADGFDVQRSPADADTWTTVESILLPTTSYRDSSLAPDTAYDYRVVATNAFGNSDPSSTVTASTFASDDAVPGPPVGLRARALNTSGMKVDWDSGAGVSFGYRVEWTTDPTGVWTPLADLPGTVSTYQVARLSAGQRYYFRVQSWNNVGDSAWAQTSGMTLTEQMGLPETFSEEGLPWPIPGRIEFADYNPGAYYDTTSGNEGSSDYRTPDSVDIGGSANPTIGWIATGEWMDYSVRIDRSGLYTMDVNYASPNSTGRLSLMLDGEHLAPEITLANTGAWGSYQNHTVHDVYLPAGLYTLRAYIENSGFNLDFVEFSFTAEVSFSDWSEAILADHSDSGSADNADGDLYPNFFEMLFGLDPLAHDADQTAFTLQEGMGNFRFPVAKGLSSAWAVSYSPDPTSETWTAVPDSSIEVIYEERDRIWYEVQIAEPAEGSLFFRIEGSP